MVGALPFPFFVWSSLQVRDGSTISDAPEMAVYFVSIFLIRISRSKSNRASLLDAFTVNLKSASPASKRETTKQKKKKRNEKKQKQYKRREEKTINTKQKQNAP